MAGLEDEIVWHILREVELGAGDGGEGLLNNLPHDIPHRLRPVERAVKVPTAEVQLLRDLVQFLIL